MTSSGSSDEFQALGDPNALDPRLDPTADLPINRRTVEWVMHEIARLNDTSATRYVTGIEKLEAFIAADTRQKASAKELTSEQLARLSDRVEEKFRSQDANIAMISRVAEDVTRQVIASVQDRASLEQRLVAETNLSAERFRAQEEATQLAQRVADRSSERLSAAVEARFAAVNEFRAQLSDIIAAQITRVEAEARFNGLDNRVLDIKSTIDKGLTTVETSDKISDRYWGYIIGFGGLLALVATLIIDAMHTVGK
jgi:hypothetical protein